MGNCENSQIIQDTHAPVLGRLGAVTDLKIMNSVWQRDYQGLFDYQSKEIKHFLYTVKESSLLMYDKERKIVKRITEPKYYEDVLKSAAFEVIKKPNYYKIQPIYVDNEQFTLQKLIWLVVKSVPHHRYPLKEKDIIKFGKQKIKIRQIVLNDSNPSGIIDINVIKANKKIYDDLKLKENVEQKVNPPIGKEDLVQEVQSVATENEQTCRICLEPGEFSNPLICPCKCSGSVRYIHLQCLRTWLGKRLNVIKSKFSIIIKWTPLTCQMCKTHYKYRIYLDNKKYYTVEIPKPGKPYVVLEVMKKNAEYSKIFHFVSLAQTSKVSIGRRKDIDVKISDDISVSRHHANIIYDFQSRKLVLEDNKSKFGTLVLVKRNLLVNPFQKGIAFQMGGEIFVFDTHRGPGSIPDYYDEEQYLNVIEKDEKQEIDEDESDENNDEQEFEDEQEDQQVNIPTNINLNNIPPLNHNNSQPNPNLLNLPSQLINQPSINSNNSINIEEPVLNNLPLQESEILDA